MWGRPMSCVVFSNMDIGVSGCLEEGCTYCSKNDMLEKCRWDPKSFACSGRHKVMPASLGYKEEGGKTAVDEEPLGDVPPGGEANQEPLDKAQALAKAQKEDEVGAHLKEKAAREAQEKEDEVREHAPANIKKTIRRRAKDIGQLRGNEQ